MAVLIHIEDPLDERLAPFRLRERALNTRADRRERVAAGLFVAEGDLVVERALAAGCVPVTAFVDAENPPRVMQRFGADVTVYGGGPEVRTTGMGLGVALSIVALFRRPAPVDAQSVAAGRRVVALEAVDNPVNVGTVTRSAAALGWDGLLLDRTSADPLSRRALRVAMGTTFALPFARVASLVEAIDAARTAGTLVVGLTPQREATPLDGVLPRVRQRVMLVVGSERSGLSDAALGACSMTACIPMAAGVDSMNAAAAVAVACYALRPRRD